MRFAGREGVVWGTDTTSPGPDPPALVYATSDGGLTWKASRTSFGAGQLYFLTPSEGWAMGSALNQVPPSTIFHTTDAGQTWEPVGTFSFPSAGFRFVYGRRVRPGTHHHLRRSRPLAAGIAAEVK